MKFSLSVAVCALSIPLFFSGCSLSSETATPSAQESSSFSFTPPKTPPNMSGTIKSLVGNEATVSVRDMSNIPDDVKKILESTTGGTMPAGGGGFVPGMGGGGGFGGGARPSGGGSTISEEDRQKIREAMAKIPTKESKVIIPVGIPMAKQSRNTDGKDVFTEASLSDIKVGANITLWTTETNGKTIAETAILRNGRSGSSSSPSS